MGLSRRSLLPRSTAPGARLKHSSLASGNTAICAAGTGNRTPRHIFIRCEHPTMSHSHLETRRALESFHYLEFTFQLNILGAEFLPVVSMRAR